MLREYEVARTCLQCGELILLSEVDTIYGFESRKYHKECRKDRKRDRARLRASGNKKQKPILQRECRFCHHQFETTNDKCFTCQTCKGVLNKTKTYRFSCQDGIKIMGFRVAVECINCHQLVLFNPDRRTGAVLYCDDCNDKVHVADLKKQELVKQIEEHHAPQPNEQYKIAKEYAKKTYPKLLKEQKIESLGTYATANMYKQNIKRDGKIDFDKERKVINRMKKQIRKQAESPLYEDEVDRATTEGDIIRNSGRKS